MHSFFNYEEAGGEEPAFDILLQVALYEGRGASVNKRPVAADAGGGRCGIGVGYGWGDALVNNLKRHQRHIDPSIKNTADTTAAPIKMKTIRRIRNGVESVIGRSVNGSSVYGSSVGIVVLVGSVELVGSVRSVGSVNKSVVSVGSDETVGSVGRVWSVTSVFGPTVVVTGRLTIPIVKQLSETKSARINFILTKTMTIATL